MDQALTSLGRERKLSPPPPRPGLLTLRVPPLAGTRCPQLDELKGVAIALVVAYHLIGIIGWGNYLHGDLGVDMFVILSGVGLSLSTAPVTGVWPFMSRRLRRIMPAYWVVLTAVLLAHAFLLKVHYSAPDIIIHYLGLHAWFGDVYLGSICDTFWFVSLILTLYLGYAFLARLALDADRLLLLGGSLSLALARYYFLNGRAGSYGLIALRFPGFFVGLLLGRLLRAGHLEFSLGPLLGLAGFVLGYAPYTQGIIFHSVPVALTLIGFYAFSLRGVLLRFLPWLTTALGFLGVHSLEIYLLHAPLIREFNFYRYRLGLGVTAPIDATHILAIGVGLAVTVVAATELRRVLGRLLPA
ncbi:MAG TPA: acyltransferase family protein [Lacunisphaera sp.]|nr:acyltransferase family protein [Lacunisphaera sp.]